MEHEPGRHTAPNDIGRRLLEDESFRREFFQRNKPDRSKKGKSGENG